MARLLFLTGASSGIGQALARRFHAAGYRVAMVARDRAALQAWVEAAGWPPDHYRLYAADVTDPDAMASAGHDCIESLGVPDVVIGCAGISVGVDTAIREDLAVMARVYAVNNLGLAATFHPFVRAMQERRSGVLVGIASVNGIRGFPGHGAYCASKAAVISYCESLRVELRASGVRVTTLCPGYVDTPLTRGNRYAMPFLMTADAFAEQAWRAIERGDSYRVIPWQMGVVAKLLRVLPNAVFDRLFAGRARKKRVDEA